MLKKTKGLEIAYKISADKTLYITPKGRLDTLTSELLLDIFEEEKKHNEDLRRVIVDASYLEYISSAGLRVLLVMSKKLDSRARIDNANAAVMEIIETTGFDDFLEVTKA